MKQNVTKTKKISYYEFEARYFPRAYKKRIKEAEEKRDDYPKILAKRIVDEVKKDFGL